MRQVLKKDATQYVCNRYVVNSTSDPTRHLYRRSSQETVAYVLRSQYLDLSHHNKKTLDELIFILLSTTTTEHVYLQTYRSFKKHFPILFSGLRSIHSGNCEADFPHNAIHSKGNSHQINHCNTQ